MREVYTSAQLAEETGYSQKTIQRMCKKGNLVAIKFEGGRKWVIPAAYNGLEKERPADAGTSTGQ